MPITLLQSEDRAHADNGMELFDNAEVVTSIFGRWPPFHDAEIVSVYLTREGESAPILEAVVHVFEATNEVDARNQYVLKNHTLVTFRFAGVCEDVSIRSFNHQNVISSLAVTSSESEGGRIAVEMRSLYGADIAFTCSEASVVSAEACTSDARLLNRATR